MTVINMRFAGSFATFALLLGAQPVLAQAGSESSANDQGVLEEIVVTAEKRESTVQKTPISMTAISEADIQAQGLSDLTQIAAETPGVSMKTSGPGQTEYEIRGLTATGGFSPTVGFYLDDAPLTAPAQAAQGKVVIDPDLYDLNRVEVLRGPQGTLYGAGSMGGTIKLVTNAPQLNTVAVTAQTKESGTDGGGFNYGGSAMLNLPIAQDVAAIRFVGTYKYTSGWIDRIVLNPFPLETNGGTTRGDVLAAPVQARYSDVNWEELEGGRVSLLLKLGDDLTLQPGVMHQKISTGGPFTIDDPPGNVYAHYQPFDIAEPLEDNFTLYTLTAKYHFDFADLTSATAKWNRHDEQTQDISETMQSLFGLPSFYPPDGIGGGSQEETDFSDQSSQEIRVASNGDGRFQWLGGFFYSNFNSNTTSTIRIRRPRAVFRHHEPDLHRRAHRDHAARAVRRDLLQADRSAQGDLGPALLPLLEHGGGHQQRYRFDRWRPGHGAGIRQREEQGLQSQGEPGLHRDRRCARLHHRGERLPPGWAEHARAAHGAGAVPDRAGESPVAGTQLRAESVQPGQCLELRGRRESARAWEHVPDQQRRLLRVAGPTCSSWWTQSCGFGFTSNAGTATVYGSEIEIAANLSPSWTVTQNVGYTHATFNDTVRATNTVKGQKLLGCAGLDREHLRHLLDAGVGRLTISPRAAPTPTSAPCRTSPTRAIICRATRW